MDRRNFFRLAGAATAGAVATASGLSKIQEAASAEVIEESAMSFVAQALKSNDVNRQKVPSAVRLFTKDVMPALEHLKQAAPDLYFKYKMVLPDQEGQLFTIVTNIPGIDPFGETKELYTHDIPLTLTAVLNEKGALYLVGHNGNDTARGTKDVMNFIVTQAKNTQGDRIPFDEDGPVRVVGRRSRVSREFNQSNVKMDTQKAAKAPKLTP